MGKQLKHKEAYRTGVDAGREGSGDESKSLHDGSAVQ